MLSPDLFPDASKFTLYEPGDVILDGDTTVRHVGYIESGLVKGRLLPKGQLEHRDTVLVVGRKGWIGFETYGNSPPPIEHIAVNETRACLVPADWALQESPPEVRATLMNGIVNQWGLRASQVADKDSTLEWKLLVWLVNLRSMTDDHEIQLTQTDLADLLGVARGVLNTQIRSLQDRGLIELHRGFFILPPAKTLQSAFLDRSG